MRVEELNGAKRDGLPGQRARSGPEDESPDDVGKQFRNAEQQADMDLVWGGVKGTGVLDYVTCWYRRAAEYMVGTGVVVGFVSTNSISQGEQVGILWAELFQRYRLKFHFAHRTFAWASEARGRAHVHVVIVGFDATDASRKRIFEYETAMSEPTEHPAGNSNPYLVEGADVWVSKRREPFGAAERMVYGSKPVDEGHLLLDD